MSDKVIVLIIVLAILAVVAIFGGAVWPYLKRHGIVLDTAMSQTRRAIDVAQKTVDLIKPFVEKSRGIDVIDKALDAARVAVGNAEQLYKLGKIPPEERHDAALNYVYDTLGLAGIAITPEVDRLVEGAIQAEVNAMGHA